MDKKRVIRGSDYVKKYEDKISEIPSDIVKRQRAGVRDRVAPRINAELDRKNEALSRVSKLKFR